MGISAKGKRKHLTNIATTSNTYHAIGQYQIMEHGLPISSPSATTLDPLQIHSTSYQELSDLSS